MDYSSANVSLWNIIIQLGLIAGVILISQFLRSKLSTSRSDFLSLGITHSAWNTLGDHTTHKLILTSLWCS